MKPVMEPCRDAACFILRLTAETWIQIWVLQWLLWLLSYLKGVIVVTEQWSCEKRSWSHRIWLKNKSPPFRSEQRINCIKIKRCSFSCFFFLQLNLVEVREGHRIVPPTVYFTTLTSSSLHTKYSVLCTDVYFHWSTHVIELQYRKRFFLVFCFTFSFFFFFLLLHFQGIFHII